VNTRNGYMHLALVSAVCACLVSGCTAVRGFPDPPATSKAVYPDPSYLLGPDAVQRYVQETDAARKKLLRNEIIDARMAELDRKFGDFERALYQEGIGTGIGTDWTVLAMTAATAMVSAASTKTDLGALSTAVIGGHASYEKRALFDKTLPALLAQMVAQRETVRLAIRTSQASPVESYSWFAAESDLQGFERAGSLPAALLTIAKDAGLKSAEAEQKLQSLREGTYLKDSAGDVLRKFWKPDGTTVDATNEAKLKAWMTQNNIATGPGDIVMFLRAEEFAASRSKAVKDLELATDTH